MSRNLQAASCKIYFTSGVPILSLQILDIVYIHSDLKIHKKGKQHDMNNLGDDQYAINYNISSAYGHTFQSKQYIF